MIKYAVPGGGGAGGPGGTGGPFLPSMMISVKLKIIAIELE